MPGGRINTGQKEKYMKYNPNKKLSGTNRFDSCKRCQFPITETEYYDNKGYCKSCNTLIEKENIVIKHDINYARTHRIFSEI